MDGLQKVYRHEKKYTMTWNEFQVANGKLKHLLKLDSNCPAEGYEVKSLYFDNPYDHALGQKIDGTDLRHKYRIRVYNNDFSFLKLEKKSKSNIMTYKDSVYLTEEEAHQIVQGDIEFLKDKEEDFFKGFYYKLKHEQYLPKVIVKYTRIAYTYPVSNLRITFDCNIKKSDQTEKFFTHGNGYMKVYNPNEVIMEVKFDHVLPTFVRSIIQSPNTMQSAASKYVASRFA
jgi:hypothetical protein